MSFDSLKDGSLDYLPCRYGNSKLLYRGPRRDLKKPYVAFLGGTETHGKFIPKPFVTLLDERIDANCVNFGYPNAGVDVFVQDPFLPSAAKKSLVTVIQVPSAHNLSNRLYSVHPRRNDRIVDASQTLQLVYPDVDFAEFHFTKHLLQHLYSLSEDRYKIVESELRQAWLARMSQLISNISGRIILLWVSGRLPHEPSDEIEPVHVDQEMMDQLRDLVTEVAVVTDDKDPDIDPLHGMVFAETESAAASETLGPAVHQKIADTLHPMLEEMLD